MHSPSSTEPPAARVADCLARTTKHRSDPVNYDDYDNEAERLRAWYLAAKASIEEVGPTGGVISLTSTSAGGEVSSATAFSIEPPTTATASGGSNNAVVHPAADEESRGDMESLGELAAQELRAILMLLVLLLIVSQLVQV